MNKKLGLGLVLLTLLSCGSGTSVSLESNSPVQYESKTANGFSAIMDEKLSITELRQIFSDYCGKKVIRSIYGTPLGNGSQRVKGACI